MIERNTLSARRARRRVWRCAVTAGALAVLALVYRFVWAPSSTAWVIAVDALYVVGLYVFRLVQQKAEEAVR